MRMTRQQRAFARSALGLPNFQRRSYCNRFLVFDGGNVREDWNDMVQAGFAIRSSGEEDTGPATFALTRAGADRAIHPGELLNPNDFPPIGAH